MTVASTRTYTRLRSDSGTWSRPGGIKREIWEALPPSAAKRLAGRYRVQQPQTFSIHARIDRARDGGWRYCGGRAFRDCGDLELYRFQLQQLHLVGHRTESDR